MEQDLFPCLQNGKQNTKYDNYADCLLFHIAYQMDAKKPFGAMIKAVYYDYPQGRVNDDYYASVFEKKRANTTYFRYWHGAVCLLRPLLCIWSVGEIRKALGICLLLLNAALGTFLWRHVFGQVAACSSNDGKQGIWRGYGYGRLLNCTW